MYCVALFWRSEEEDGVKELRGGRRMIVAVMARWRLED